MSTSLPLAGELADDLLYRADAIGAYPFGREDAQRAGYHLVSEPIRKPNADFPARRSDLHWQSGWIHSDVTKPVRRVPALVERCIRYYFNYYTGEKC